MAAEVAEPCGLLRAALVFFTGFLFVVTANQIVFRLFCLKAKIWSLYQLKECANVTKEFNNATKILKNFWLSG